jgi:N12 class adenine-specific DNA methylase
VSRLTNSYESLAKQKEEGELSNKKVIANLKEKLKGQTDKISEMQNQIVEIRISR